MSQKDYARRFAELHVKGSPVLLYNAWDAGSAKAIQAAGARAVATSSWAVAAAWGYADGEAIPRDLVEQLAARIVASVDLPVSLDFEGGYSEDDGELAANVARLVELGVVGINFEDRVVKGQGLYDVDRQARRIAAIREVAERKRVPLFINARTDLFLGAVDGTVEEALARGAAYAAAGASGFFIPGLDDAAAIGRICDGVALPVNAMMLDGMPGVETLARLGVARVSYGALSYLQAVASIEQQAKAAFESQLARKE